MTAEYLISMRSMGPAVGAPAPPHEQRVQGRCAAHCFLYNDYGPTVEQMARKQHPPPPSACTPTRSGCLFQSRKLLGHPHLLGPVTLVVFASRCFPGWLSRLLSRGNVNIYLRNSMC